MSRKHYEAIAAAIKSLDIRGEHANGGKLVLKAEVIHSIGRKLAADNPRFNYAKFLVACYDDVKDVQAITPAGK